MPLAGGGRHAAASHAATRRASRESRATAFSSERSSAEHGERSKWLTAKAATSVVAAVATVGSGKSAAAEASNPPLLDARARNLSREAAMGDAPIRESTTPSTDGSPRKRSSVQALRERVKRSSVIVIPQRGLARLEQRCRAIPLPGQERARQYYQSNSAQYLFAFLIFGNFVCAMLEKQFDPQSINYRHEFEVVFDVFNTMFLIELLWNLYGHGLRFWTSWWNLFDTLIVACGVVGTLERIANDGETGTVGQFVLLRTLRAFRVFRLFKRVKSLNKIIVALGKAVPGITNAAFVMLLVMCIYAILGVEFYGPKGDMLDDSYLYVPRTDLLISARTADLGVDGLNIRFAEEYFGNFGLSVLTMFQVLTGDSWAIIARTLLFTRSGTHEHQSSGLGELGVAFFFVSYIMLMSFTLINVVIAVLLEKTMEEDVDDPYDDEMFSGFDDDTGGGGEAALRELGGASHGSSHGSRFTSVKEKRERRELLERLLAELGELRPALANAAASSARAEDAATAAQRQITALEHRLGGGGAAAAEPPRHTSVQFANGEQQLATIHSAEELPPPQAGAGATGRKFSANV